MSALQSVVPLRFFPENRASMVGMLSRSICTLFGSPSFMRANGICETGTIAKAASKFQKRRKCSVPVFQIDRRGSLKGETLPKLWLSEPDLHAENENNTKRKFVCSYPIGRDAGGMRALELAEKYFSEGLAHFGQDCSIACFQAAELLYMHACNKGNVEAYTRLGVLYKFDMCKGNYWKDTLSTHAKHAADSVIEKAVRAFRRAAARGSSEAKWQLGDMVHGAIGCQANEALAYNLYIGSFSRAACCSLTDIKAAHDSNTILALVEGSAVNLIHAGCAARRIALCMELGSGCAKNIQLAKAWYTAAVYLLDSCVAGGSWYYAEELAKAQIALGRL
ncbi:hypothetical protein [Adlercreutzia sp. ZJ304]|uniref:hypothetical protein n=1 Tax=Adlercreutzia sp. ZJ304 TaxID=2709791 RepID=UPI0013ED60A3|nr:hypothetical protein [Adlercreutzia sp. ZJ304]